MDDASAALLHAHQALYFPVTADPRRALADDPILHAVYTHGVEEGMRRARQPDAL